MIKLAGKIFAGAAFVAMAFSANAWADSEEEKKKLWRCATDLCSIILTKNPKGPDLSCDLTKTWDKKLVEKGAQSKNIGWDFGQVSCHFKVSVRRADVATALSGPEGRLKLSKQAVACEIGDDHYPIKATAAPVLKFKNGSVTEATLRVEDIDGSPVIQGVVWTAAKLERHFGVFEKDIVRETNKFIQKECLKFATPPK